MRRRLLVVFLALVTAAVAATLLVVSSRQSSSTSDTGVMSDVLVATGRIEPGTTGQDAAASVHLTQVPASALVPGALVDLASVNGMQALGPILPGQQLMAGQWGETLISPLRPPVGMLGVAVQLGDPQRVAGFVTPGSKVAVFATLTDTGGQPRTRLLLAPVGVLGVGGSTLTTRTVAADGSTSTEQVPSAVLTLALTPTQAEQVVFATTEGQLHLGLLGDHVKPATGSGVTAGTLFGGSS